VNRGFDASINLWFFFTNTNPCTSVDGEYDVEPWIFIVQLNIHLSSCCTSKIFTLRIMYWSSQEIKLQEFRKIIVLSGFNGNVSSRSITKDPSLHQCLKHAVKNKQKQILICNKSIWAPRWWALIVLKTHFNSCIGCQLTKAVKLT